MEFMTYAFSRTSLHHSTELIRLSDANRKLLNKNVETRKSIVLYCIKWQLTMHCNFRPPIPPVVFRSALIIHVHETHRLAYQISAQWALYGWVIDASIYFPDPLFRGRGKRGRIKWAIILKSWVDTGQWSELCKISRGHTEWARE